MQARRTRNVAGATVLTALIAAGTCAAVAPGASAAGCVSARELSNAKKLMTVSQVHQVFGTKGRVFWESDVASVPAVLRIYPSCALPGPVRVLFDDGRLVEKWLPGRTMGSLMGLDLTGYL